MPGILCFVKQLYRYYLAHFPDRGDRGSTFLRPRSAAGGVGWLGRDGRAPLVARCSSCRPRVGRHSGSARVLDLTGASTTRRGFGTATRQPAKSISDNVLVSCLQTHTIRGSPFFILFPCSLFLVFFFLAASWGDEAEEQTLDVSS